MRLCWECRIYPDEVTIAIRETGEDDYVSDAVMVEFSWVRWQDGEKRHISLTFICEIRFRWIDQLNDAAKAARKIIKKVEQDLEGYKPIDVIRALEAIKVVEVVHDGRMSNFIPIGEILPVEYKCWYDGLEIEGGYGKYKSIRIKEANAQADIVAQAASANDLDWVNKFIEAGMPVEISGVGLSVPDTTPAIERLEKEELG